MPRVSVLTVYNAYLNRGGEDEVFEAEAELLERHGHRVERFRVEADDLRRPPLLQRPRIALETVWSQRYYRRFREMVRELRPDVVHFHNAFPLLSPAAYVACKREGAAVVQTLHNYRLLCPGATFFRDGHPCEDCLPLKFQWPSIVHACYHESPVQTAVIATMLAAHRLRGTWNHDIDMYVTPTEFARRKFVEGGLIEDRIAVKPNFIDYDAPPRQGPGEYMLFVGRLVEHKGVATMLEAWREACRDVPLRIIGDGPMAGGVQAYAAGQPNVEYLGRRPHEAVLREMLAARALLFPSKWYEGLPLTLVEAAASGLPAIVSDLGPMGSELVEHGRTGLVFPPGDAAVLAARVNKAWQEPDVMQVMGEAARRVYQDKYTPERNYDQLIAIYSKAMAVSLSAAAAAEVPVPAGV